MNIYFELYFMSIRKKKTVQYLGTYCTGEVTKGTSEHYTDTKQYHHRYNSQLERKNLGFGEGILDNSQIFRDPFL